MSNDLTESWNRLSIAGKPADVYVPAGRDLHPGAILFLHGHRLETLVGDDVFTREFAKHRIPVVCPHGARSWWLDLICDEFDDSLTPMSFLRKRVVPWMGERWGVAPPLIGLLGISMGGQGALQLAYRHAREFPVVAAISPAVDFHQLLGQGLPLDEMFHDGEAARQHTVTLNLHPLNWPRHQLLVCDPADTGWYEGTERLASKLTSTGIPFESDLETSAGGHTWGYFHRMAERTVGFVAEGLRKESRREP